MLKLTRIENYILGVSQLWHTCVTIVAWVCHNCGMGVSQLWHGGVTIVSWVSQLWHTYVNPEILVLISDDWQYKSTNTTVKKKNQIPSLSMLKLTWIENAFPCHNCDTPVTQLWHTHVTIVTHLIGHFQFRSILTYLMMEFDFFSSQLYL